MTVRQFDQWQFDTADGRLERIDGTASVTLRPQVARLLECFLQHPEVVIDRDTLYRAVWGDGAVVDFESGLAAVLRELRQALGELGASDDLIETIPRRGYRLRGEVRELATMGQPVRARPLWRPLLVAAAVLALALLAFGGWWRLTGPGAFPGDEFTLAILPLEQYGDHERPPEHGGVLVADNLLAQLWLADLEHVALIGRVGMLPYIDREDVAAAVARDLNLNLLMEGTVLSHDSGWQVDVRLLTVPSGRILWSESVHWEDTHRLPVSESAEVLVDRLKDAWPDLLDRLTAESSR